MKKALILVVSSELPPYGKMIDTSKETWDSINVEGCETVFYCSDIGTPKREGVIYFPLGEGYESMGHRMLLAFDWALKNKKFDYIARVNSSCYVNKKELIKHIQLLPDYNLFAGIEVAASPERSKWCWGGGQFIFSKDVIQKIIDNKERWNHSIMEDVAVSHLVDKIGIPFNPGKSCSINKTKNGWSCFGYGGESFEFTDFTDMNKSGQHFIRVKQDLNRDQDEFIMKELFKNLK